MALAQREIVDMKNPKYMSQKYFNTLKAGSEVVTMTLQSPYLFENVMKICEYLTEEDAKEAMGVYQKAFLERFTNMIIDYSNCANNQEQFSTIQKKLTNVERELFEQQKRQRVNFGRWKNQDGPKVEFNSDMVQLN